MATKSKPTKAPKKKAPAGTRTEATAPEAPVMEAPKTRPATGVFGYLPDDTPPVGATLSLGFQQFLTMFPATVLVAILTKFDVGITLLASGLGTIIALLVARRKIPMYYCGGHHGNEQICAGLFQ
jgi:hypothetical protein